MTHGKTQILFAVLPLCALFFIGGCDKSDSGTSQSNDGGSESRDEKKNVEAASHDEEDIVTLTPDQLAEIGAEIAVAGPGAFDIKRVLAGEIVMNPDRVAHVVAQASGIATDILKTMGNSVVSGEPLAILESANLAQAKANYLSNFEAFKFSQADLARAEEIYENTRKLLQFLQTSPDLGSLGDFSDLNLGQNRSALISAYAEMKTAKAVYEREYSLYQKKIGSEAEFIEAESNKNITEAAFASVRDDLSYTNKRTLELMRRNEKVAGVTLLASERTLHALGLSEVEVSQVVNESDDELARYIITSPINGTIVERHISRGELLEDSTDVFTVADLSTVWVNLIVYPKDIASMHTGLIATISIGDHVPDLEGEISYVSPIVDEETRTATARIIIDNKDAQWRPGLFVTAQVTVERVEGRVVVPKDAIQRINGENVIFVQTPEGFEPRKVLIGESNSSMAEITEGLNPGEKYAAVNAFTIKSELGKSGFEEGH